MAPQQLGECVMPVEIERRWLISSDQIKLIRRIGSPTMIIKQGYLAVETGHQVRIRSTGTCHELTYKVGEGMIRQEFNIHIDIKQFEYLWPGVVGRHLIKERREFDDGPYRYFIDLYCGTLEGLGVVEIEFENKGEADAFVPPDWFGKEVTGVEAYSNFSLATRGLPNVG